MPIGKYSFLYRIHIFTFLLANSSRVGSSPVLRNRTKNSANEQLLFHGTNRFCRLGEDASKVRLCHLSKCHLCCVLRNSFDLNKCGWQSYLVEINPGNSLAHPLGTKHKFRRFGTGIYTTSCSSSAWHVASCIFDSHLSLPEADDYTLNGEEGCRLRILLVSRVVVGNPYKRRYNATDLAEPPCGHHSVSTKLPFCLCFSI
jgi:hypothetical protein